MPSGTPERVAHRNTRYSKWRRKCCARDQYMTDVDAVEWRDAGDGTRRRRLAAIIETKIGDADFPDWQRDVLVQVADGCALPAFLVRHDGEWIPADDPKAFRGWAMNEPAAAALGVPVRRARHLSTVGWRSLLRSL